MEERVLDEAMFDGAHQSLTPLGCQADWAVNADSDIVEPSGSFELLGLDRNLDAAVGKIARAQILGRVKGRAGPERSEKKLGWRHTSIATAVLPWLIANDRMSPRLD